MFCLYYNHSKFYLVCNDKKLAQRLKQVKVVPGTRAIHSHIYRPGWLNEYSLYTGLNTLLSRKKIMNIDEKTRLD